MSNQIQTVNFHNQSLITLKDGIAYVAMKPICDNIGLDWTAQCQRINCDEVLNAGSLMPFAERRKQVLAFLDKHRAKKQHYLH